MTIYFISGLGADKHAFRKLQFPEECKIKYLDWIANVDDETLSDYALRMSKSIDTEEPFSLVGLSMGGMLAIELSKIIHPDKIAIISSASTYKEISFLYRLAGKLKLHKLLPYQYGYSFRRLIYWFMGSASKEEKTLISYFIRNTTPSFIRWAIAAILNWKNNYRPRNLLHIHGTADRLLPIKYTNADIKIKGGGHLMILSQSQAISQILIEFLSLKGKS